jgi:ATP-dependent DNA helicase RecG
VIIAVGNPRAPFRIMAEDNFGNVCALVFFGRNAGWARKQLPLNEKRWIAGRLDQFGQSLQIVHPDHRIGRGGGDGQDGRAGLSPVRRPDAGAFGAVIGQALSHIVDLPEWIEPALKSARAGPIGARRSWPRTGRGWRARPAGL